MPNAKWKCSSRIETARKDFMRSHRTKKPKNPPTRRLVEFEARPFSRVPSWFSFDAFSTDPRGRVGLDVGCSTGGFTDCLLQRGIKRVYAVDVGYGLIDWKLRQDSRVILLERTNIRYMDRSLIPEPIDLAVIDVSFISLKLVLPSVVPLLREDAHVIALVKPQFEVGKGQVGAGGIVRDDAQRRAVTERVIECAAGLGLQNTGTLDSPVKGRKGNREILVSFLRRGIIASS